MFPLLQPDAERIMPAEHKPARDRAPEELALGNPLWLRDDFVELIGEAQVHSRLIDLVKYATDASPYRMFPKQRHRSHASERAFLNQVHHPVICATCCASLEIMVFFIRN